MASRVRAAPALRNGARAVTGRLGCRRFCPIDGYGSALIRACSLIQAFHSIFPGDRELDGAQKQPASAAPARRGRGPRTAVPGDARGRGTEPATAAGAVGTGPGASRIGAAAAGALAYIHGRGILHRDITPGNILLDRRDGVFLTDFGIAKAWDGPDLTAENLIPGTLGYLAPEQAEGRGASAASDVYALGLVLLEALTGVREYSGTPLERAFSAVRRSPRIPSTLGEMWCSTLRRMTTRDRIKRPTAAEVRALLSGRAETADEAVSACHPAVGVSLAAHLGLAG